MKGFYIEIKNELLDPKHHDAMKMSVWLFMWFIDKMTSISEQGIGLVGGGYPIKFEDIKKDLGIAERTYNKYVSLLKSGGYILTKRTPYGLIVSVNKASKRFKQRSAQNGVSEQRDPQKSGVEIRKKWHRDPHESTDLIKTIQRQDNIQDKREGGTPLTPAEEMNEFIQDKTMQEKVISYLIEKKVPELLARKEITKFLSYWTELNKSGTKQRWEMEHTFELRRRLSTWVSRINNFSDKKTTFASI